MIESKRNSLCWATRFLAATSLVVITLTEASCGITPTATLAAMGDSVTWGYGSLPGGWVSALESRSGFTISNLGIPGEKAAGGIERVTGALAVVPGAKVVLLLHGGNDWVGIFRGGECSSECDPSTVDGAYVAVGERVATIASRIRDQGKTVVHATYWPSSAQACNNYTPERFVLYQAHLARLNAETVKVAKDSGAAIVRLDDLAEIAKDPTNFFDCLHPSRQGYELIAERWLKDSQLWEP